MWCLHACMHACMFCFNASTRPRNEKMKSKCSNKMKASKKQEARSNKQAPDRPTPLSAPSLIHYYTVA